ncbi:prephenate dehydrogenase [Achromatium sp. WMS3]|nr:prephenate dehydrogenase [Achromatium sp. WMS3]
MIERLTIIGVGLIGGSLARALRKVGAVGEIIGCGRGWPNLERALALGVIDHATDDPVRAVQGADLVFLAVPLGAMANIFNSIKHALAEHTIITDGGSVKSSVIEDARRSFGFVPNNMVPGHPVAGTEHSGVEASFASLYQNSRVILTPLANTNPQATNLVERMWRACGANVIYMSAAHHDGILAATSHLPHMLAFGLVDLLANMQDNNEIFRYAAGGFRDFSRIASSNPLMWRDICLANNDALRVTLQKFIEELHNLTDALGDPSGTQLLDIFTRAKTARDHYLEQLSDEP